MLTFDLRDQAELLGLIDRLGNLGLQLRAIESLDTTTDTGRREAVKARPDRGDADAGSDG